MIIKWGLVEIPPITFAGLRYILAFFCFIPFVLNKKYILEIKQLQSVQWKKLILLGLIFYTFTQGAQFLGLSLLPSVTVSLMLNFTPLIVAIMGIYILNENPSSAMDRRIYNILFSDIINRKPSYWFNNHVNWRISKCSVGNNWA